MRDLTVECRLQGHRTVIRISGDVVPQQCRMFGDALDVGYALDPSGPVEVDLSGVNELTAPGMVVLRAAVATARRAGRTTTVRNLDATAVEGRGRALQRLLAACP